jgi:hypothetical protein
LILVSRPHECGGSWRQIAACQTFGQNLARTVLRPGDKVQRWRPIINSKRAGVGIYLGKHREFRLAMRVQSHRPT